MNTTQATTTKKTTGEELYDKLNKNPMIKKSRGIVSMMKGQKHTWVNLVYDGKNVN